MTRLILISVLGSCLFSVHGAQADGYLEGTVGAGFIPGVDTKTYSVVVPPDTITGQGSLDYDPALTLGAEIGADLGFLKWGLSYDYLNAQLSSASGTVSLNGVPVISGTVDDSVVEALGISFDNDVHLAAANLYFEPEMRGFMQPYVGIGAGAAFISHADTEPALTATLGVRQPVGQNWYLGLRYRYVHIWGPTDDFGIEYEPINAHLISVLLGTRF